MLRALFLLLPPAEILLLIQVADRYGWGAVILACIAGFLVGSTLIRLRGKVFFRQAMEAANRNQVPTEALVGGIAWYVAGLLFMVPGFITDGLALIVLLPPVRRRLLDRFAKLAEAQVMTMGGTGAGGGFRWPPEQGGFGHNPGQGYGHGDVYEGEARPVDEPNQALPPPEHPEAPGQTPPDSPDRH